MQIQTVPICKIRSAATGKIEMVNSQNKTKTGTYHFIGAGGIGMSGLAKLLLKNGATVTGSDQEQTAVTEKLCAMGATIKIGHAAENITNEVETVVISAAIRETNPELAEARKRGCTVYKYAQMLGLLMDHYRGIAISGTHGKSTTSGWLAHTLVGAGTPPNFIVGADVIQLNDSSGVGESDLFIAEACEYDRSFLNLHPEIAVILNIDQDHLDYYRDIKDIKDAFCEFASGIRDDGMIIANGQDPNVRSVLNKLDKSYRCATFGLDKSCDFFADNIQMTNNSYEFDVYHKDKHLGHICNPLPGEHNIFNALVVISIAVTAGLEFETISESLQTFTGIDRRLMFKAEINGITILDDYAHHPTEIRASLAAIRQKYQPKQLWCIFQPHQYSRTRFLLDDFAESFKLSDITIVPEIYFVRDTAETKKKVSAEMLVECITQQGSKALFINDFDGICNHLKDNVKPGDLVVTMGAGTVWKVADEYIQWLGRNS